MKQIRMIALVLLGAALAVVFLPAEKKEPTTPLSLIPPGFLPPLEATPLPQPAQDDQLTRVAGWQTLPPLATLPLVVHAETPVDVTSVDGGAGIYVPPFPSVIRGKSGAVKVGVKGVPANTKSVKWVIGAKKVDSKPVTLTTGTGVVEPKDPLETGVYSIELEFFDDPTKDRVAAVGPFRLAVPGEQPFPPAVSLVSNGTNRKSEARVSGLVDVYNRYLRLEGSGLNLGDALEMVAFDAANTAVPSNVAVRMPPFDSRGNWQADVTLPEVPQGAIYQLRVWLVRGGQYSRPFEDIKFRLQPAALDRPSVGIPKAGGKDLTLVDGVYSTNLSSLKIPVAVAKGADRQLLLFADELGSALATPIELAKEDTQKEFEITIPEDGRYTLRAALAQGDLPLQKSEAKVVVVSTRGPRVVGVRPLDFGTTPGNYAVTIQFDPNHLLDSKATEKANYELNGTPSTVDGVYDPATNSVTLDFKGMIQAPGVYKLAVKPTIKDRFGNPLEGVPGSPNSNYTTSLLNPIGGDLPSVGRGITGTSAPFVAFPEFTPPREVPDGANPSDKVETRVARLYYSRDAHRVAQIINRDVKSYNYAAVAVRRRLADAARDKANNQTDDRRAQERGAVRAAQLSREAEARVAQAQAALGTARQTAEQATQTVQGLDTQITQADQLLVVANGRRVQWQNELERRRANVQPDPTLVDNLQKAEAKTRILVDEREKLRLRLPLTAEAGRRELEQKIADKELEIQDAQVEERAARAALARVQLRSDVKEADDAVAQTSEAIRTLELRLSELRRQRSQASTVAAAETANIQSAQARIQNALAEVQARRNEEVAENEKALRATATEDRWREEQYQREVAAAHEDPDTHAMGVPNSNDPVQQVSISVIGEGLIQLRGPLKGINVIRTMINQIDSPVGQVRVAIHTMQVNGEHGDRMEKVVRRIQHYVDHSRFLTEQSGQMLRKAVTLVASRRAQEAIASCPPGSQEGRDQRYLYSFFGRDFIDELIQLDSEFLKTGNKLLSLHSMDSTSLAAALFVMALAKNSTRREILEEFERMLEGELPRAEYRYFESSNPPKECRTMRLLGGSARFQSLLGFFNADVEGPDTINPIQREFIKLAQIFKNRLVVELEYKQRVLERTVIEERFVGNYRKLIVEQQKKEQYAAQVLALTQKAVNEQRIQVFEGFAKLNGRVRQLAGQALAGQQIVKEILQEATRGTQEIETATKALTAALETVATKLNTSPQKADPKVDEALDKATKAMQKKSLSSSSAANAKTRAVAAASLEIARTKITERMDVSPQIKAAIDKQANKTPSKISFRGESVRLISENSKIIFADQDAAKWQRWIEEAVTFGRQFLVVTLNEGVVRDLESEIQKLKTETAVTNNEFPENGDDALFTYYRWLSDNIMGRVVNLASGVQRQTDQLSSLLTQTDFQVQQAYDEWVRLRETIRSNLRGGLAAEAQRFFDEIDQAFGIILKLNLQLQFAQRDAEESRRPLDHKKLLDMFIDDVEDKYIELLEGTRAHTSNIDNYIKQLATALDDDFHTQFYLPAFREVRQASRMWDVNLGNIETTSILTNNRAFAKVSPQATMEFDLPKRDILIAEAMNGSLAMMNTYGALLQDPTFLALTKLRSGQPPSSPVQGSGAGLSTVRTVLPSLPSSTEERVLSQAGPGRREFATPLEALIPDPAVYKFETGTGYEIRPVLSPDGQAVVFHFNYMYTTNVREPVRADEKHLGRVKRHFIDTDVQLSNFELREISRYVVALKASRTSRGVPLLEDIPGLGLLFRPLPSAESSLQENLIYGQAVIFPTLFDLMGLRWAPAIADLDPLRTVNQEFVTRSRLRDLKNRTYDFSASKVDEFLRIPPADRRPDLYRTQETVPHLHPNGYQGPGLGLHDSRLREGYDVRQAYPSSRYVPSGTSDTAPFRPSHEGLLSPGMGGALPPLEEGLLPGELDPRPGFALPPFGGGHTPVIPLENPTAPQPMRPGGSWVAPLPRMPVVPNGRPGPSPHGGRLPPLGEPLTPAQTPRPALP